jgi:hypothetical protein
MSDIVKRLRWEDSARQVKGIATEAADEIERLREALELIATKVPRKDLRDFARAALGGKDE